ncbi:hypothetical protein RMSM_02125 [Rhodopirellula maiorica SM1]|uniref:Uncharacterized protein n=1 Tax=Rhodopirellula maiorica SM1 TaxID=1265738 RepID=M5RP18_9BACT|nr:hypothetical protein RMSM_02125 [Rhodopirellula maiorica SM1]
MPLRRLDSESLCIRKVGIAYHNFPIVGSKPVFRRCKIKIDLEKTPS